MSLAYCVDDSHCLHPGNTSDQIEWCCQCDYLQETDPYDE